LLTRDGEIEIAKCMKASEQHVFGALGDCKSGRNGVVSERAAALRRGDLGRLRFGLGDAGEHPLEQVGERFGVSREHIRPIGAKALARLKLRSCDLGSFLEERAGP
jgi:hypothetical protein